MALNKHEVLERLKGKLHMYEELQKEYGTDLKLREQPEGVERDLYKEKVIRNIRITNEGDAFNHVYLDTVINKIKERIASWES